MPTINIRKAEGKWVVRAGGAVLGESTDALEVTDASGFAVIYFPRDDIAMAFLDASESSTVDADKGKASYFSIETKNGTLSDAAWCYEDPNPGYEQLAGRIAFHATDKVTVERL